MSVDESTRLRIRQYLIELMDERAADAMMELMPPIPWTELATKDDTAQLDERLGGVEDRLDTLTQTTNQIASNVLELAGVVSTQGASLASRIDSVSERIDAVSERMDGVSERMDGVSERMDSFGADMNALGRSVAVGAMTMAVMLAVFIAGTVASLVSSGALG